MELICCTGIDYKLKLKMLSIADEFYSNHLINFHLLIRLISETSCFDRILIENIIEKSH